jgi:hypothetical protein
VREGASLVSTSSFFILRSAFKARGKDAAAENSKKHDACFSHRTSPILRQHLRATIFQGLLARAF